MANRHARVLVPNTMTPNIVCSPKGSIVILGSLGDVWVGGERGFCAGARSDFYQSGLTGRKHDVRPGVCVLRCAPGPLNRAISRSRSGRGELGECRREESEPSVRANTRKRSSSHGCACDRRQIETDRGPGILGTLARSAPGRWSWPKTGVTTAAHRASAIRIVGKRNSRLLGVHLER